MCGRGQELEGKEEQVCGRGAGVGREGGFEKQDTGR